MRPTCVKSKLSTVALLAVATLSCAVLVACSTPASPSATSTGTPSPTASAPSATANEVTLHGVSVALPTGWFEAAPKLCGTVAEHSVTIYTGRPQVASCPAFQGVQLAVESIQLVEIFGSWGSVGWSGTKTTWDGQPAWITQEAPGGVTVTPCPSASGRGPCPSGPPASELLTTTLALPWLNATVVVSGATAARIQELLTHVSVHAQPDVTVPASASKMSVTQATLGRPASTTTAQPVIDATLKTLRGLPALPVSAACKIPGYFGPAVGGLVVTFDGSAGQTSFLVAMSPCNEVTSGTGAASQADTALYLALAKVPLQGYR